MKVLMLRGNPRKNGVTERLADLFARGLRESGAELFDVDLASKNIGLCRGCFACSAGEKGRCVIDDDMADILDLLDEADAVVCASPIYFYAMGAQLKIFWERCFPFIRGYYYDAELGGMRNRTNFSKDGKKFVTIGAASGRIKSSFEAVTHTYQSIATALGFEYAADIRRAESPHFTSLDAKSLRVRKILDAFEIAGREFGATGKISEAVIKTAELELAESDEVFAQNAGVFWELNKNRNVVGFGFDDSKTDVRILLREMCRLLIPKEAPKKADIEFYFPDKEWRFAMRINSGKCELGELSAPSECDLRITCTAPLWADILGMRANVMEKLASGELLLEGRRRLFSSMKKYFRLPDGVR